MSKIGKYIYFKGNRYLRLGQLNTPHSTRCLSCDIDLNNCSEMSELERLFNDQSTCNDGVDFIYLYDSDMKDNVFTVSVGRLRSSICKDICIYGEGSDACNGNECIIEIIKSCKI